MFDRPNSEKFDERLSPESLEERIISEAILKANERKDRDRIRMEDFADDLPLGTVEQDLQTVATFEEALKRRKATEDLERRFGAVLEEIFADQIQNDWLGPEAESYKASRYDDMRNGVDDIIELNESGSPEYMALAIDVTRGSRIGLVQKFIRIRDEIRKGTLGTVRYFRKQDGSVGLEGIPHLVIGVDRPQLVELARLWVEGNNSELASHPAQLQILDEVLLQLKAFRSYAAATRGVPEHVVPTYDHYIATVERILASPAKQALRRRYGRSYEDQVFKAIETAAKDLPTLQESADRAYVPIDQKITKPHQRILRREGGESRPFTLE